jgi:endonuclease-3
LLNRTWIATLAAMARKSPRSRRNRNPEPSLPGKNRPRAVPGHSRTSARVAATTRRAAAGQTHAPKGARPAPGPPGSAAARGQSRPALRRGPAARRAATPERPAAAKGGAAKARRFTPPTPERVGALIGILERLYPGATTPLGHESALQLLVATILSAQCTDERVNQVTPALFARFPDARSLASASRAELEDLIHSTGFFRNKAKAIQAMSADLVQRHGGEVPRTLEELTALPGVGRKTANVVLGSAFGIPGIVVDTHVQRLALRLGLTKEHDPVKTEFALQPLIPREQWSHFSLWLIFHGRRICVARKPRCSVCPLLPHCPRLGVASSQ